MADNQTVSATAVFDAATDEIAGVHWAKVKLAAGQADSTAMIPGDANRGLKVYPGAITRISQTPTIDTSAYDPGDAIGGLLTFANAAGFSGGGCRLRKVIIIDKGQEMAPLDLVLFDRTFTNTADQAAFDPSDADLANLVGVVPITNWSNFTDNSVGQSEELDLHMLLNGTSLFGQLVNRGSPTYSGTSDLIVVLSISQDN